MVKKKTKTNKINIYAKNARFTSEENKIYLSNLINALKENQWLKVSKEKYNPIVNAYEGKSEKADWKPIGSWFSKGSWIFHEDMCCNIDDYIILIEVDYKNIFKVSGVGKKFDKSFKNLTKKYGKKFSNGECLSDDIENNNKCKINSNKRKCKSNDGCFWYPASNIFKWGNMARKYDGFALYPHPSMNYVKKAGDYKTALLMLDVESLALWSEEPVKKHYNLGSIRELLDIKKGDDYNFQEKLKKLSNILIEKINIINNIGK